MKTKGNLLDSQGFEIFRWARKSDTRRVFWSKRGMEEETDGLFWWMIMGKKRAEYRLEVINKAVEGTT